MLSSISEISTMRATRREAALPGPLPGVQDARTVSIVEEVNTNAAERARASVASLYKERGEEFFHYARGFGRDEELARDAVQEAFMRYFVRLYEGDQIADSRAWVYRVLHNYLVDRLKERRNHDERSLDDAFNRTRTENVENDCIRKEVLERVKRTLTGREYDCFCLRSEGLRYEEIAAELRLTSGTVGTLLYRAVRKLGAVLNPKKDGEM